MPRKKVARLLTTLVLGLLAGGLAGVGVAKGWYAPPFGVAMGALVGVGVGLQIRALRRDARERGA